MDASRLLIVKDERINAFDLTMQLRSLGYHICGIVTSGPDAIMAAMHYRPDLIFMYLDSEAGMDGIRTAKIIRSKSTTPIIFITSYADLNSLKKHARDDFDCLVKPFSSGDLNITVTRALAGHGALRTERVTRLSARPQQARDSAIESGSEDSRSRRAHATVSQLYDSSHA